MPRDAGARFARTIANHEREATAESRIDALEKSMKKLSSPLSGFAVGIRLAVLHPELIAAVERDLVGGHLPQLDWAAEAVAKMWAARAGTPGGDE